MQSKGVMIKKKLSWAYKVSFLFDVLINLLSFSTQLPLKHENSCPAGSFPSTHLEPCINSNLIKEMLKTHSRDLKQPLTKIQEHFCCFSFLIFTLNLVELGWPVHFIYSIFSTRTEQKSKMYLVSALRSGRAHAVKVMKCNLHTVSISHKTLLQMHPWPVLHSLVILAWNYCFHSYKPCVFTLTNILHMTQVFYNLNNLI